jgi:preprotein translocase SecE subunit
MMAVLMAYAAFACHHWFYNWADLRNLFDGMVRGTFLGFLTNWMYDPAAMRYISGIGTALLAGAMFLISYYYVYVKPATAEFLIKTDTELAKVTWPKATPWFRMDTQVWGATYVVLIVVLLMTVFVFGIDMILQWAANYLFYGGKG